MSLKKTFIIALAFLVTACGDSKSGDVDQETVDAPVIVGSSAKGFAFTAVNVDQSHDGSSLFFYDFSEGAIHTLLSGEGRDPVVFAHGNKAIHFNRHQGGSNFRVVEDLSDPESVPVPTVFDGAAGDPWDIATLVSDQTIAAAGIESGLITIDLLNGTTSTPVESDGYVTAPHFTGVMRHGAELFALHRGISGEKADGTEQIFQFNVAADGTPSVVDTNPATLVADGITYTGSNVVGFTSKGSTASFVSLCFSTVSNCQASALSFSTSTNEVTEVASLDGLSLEFHNQIVQGPDAKTVYAHVKDGATFKVVKLNIETGTIIKEIHSYGSDDRPYGIAFDKGSNSLFVGGLEDLSGRLHIYQDDEMIDDIELDTVPYNGAFIAKP
jgi:hypothetical protein